MSTPAASSLWLLPGLRLAEEWPAREPGPLLHRFQDAPVPVFALGLPRDPAPWIEALEPGASQARRERAARFRHRADALRCLAAEALLRHALAELHGLEGDLHLEAGPHGKPRLAGREGVQFSLSHSGAWVLCAVHRAPVGVDVEEIRPGDPLPLDLALGAGEREHYGSLRPPEAAAFFCRVWTLKESLLKATGLGLAIDPGRIRLALGESPIRAGHPEAALSMWRLAELPMPEGAAAALCW